MTRIDVARVPIGERYEACCQCAERSLCLVRFVRACLPGRGAADCVARESDKGAEKHTHTAYLKVQL